MGLNGIILECTFLIQIEKGKKIKCSFIDFMCASVSIMMS